MDVREEAFFEEVDRTLEDLNQLVYDQADAEQEQAMTAENTTQCLGLIVQRFGTMSYAFNYIEDKFVEYFYDEGLELQLTRVLKEQLPANPSRARRDSRVRARLNIAFAAYYALSLVYKKDRNMSRLRELADEENTGYSRAFQSYPLFHEVRSRFYKRDGRYRDALVADEVALRKLQSGGIDNYGVMISYASTVCSMLEQGENLSREEIRRAEGYIEKALAYNPSYAKYHYLKGRLLFYSSLDVQDPGIFEEARDCVYTALTVLDSEGNHSLEETQLYKKLISQIDQRMSPNPFQELSEADVKRMKREVLAGEDPKTCGPEVPRLKRGDKYIFICYCSKDYQSVYCDLVELYRRKVPFQYDKALNVGIDWSEQVSKKMEHEDCVGALFFISKNTVLSEAVEQEIRFILNKQKESQDHRPLYFAVNLEGRTHPLDILFQVIQENSLEQLHRYHVDESRITTFLQAFPDKNPFASKLGEPDSDAHLNSLYDSIRKTFPQLKLPEKPAM